MRLILGLVGVIYQHGKYQHVFFLQKKINSGIYLQNQKIENR